MTQFNVQDRMIDRRLKKDPHVRLKNDTVSPRLRFLLLKILTFSDSYVLRFLLFKYLIEDAFIVEDFFCFPSSFRFFVC